jgi:repressor LexA
VEYLLGKETPAAQSDTFALDHNTLRMVPLFETVSAGFGAYASEDIQDYMPVYFHNPSEAAQTICIKVRGNSMSPKIEDGDIIQVHKQESVDDGSIAVVLVDGDEGLVKKLQYRPDGVDLISMNPMYPPMRFDATEASRVRVVGLVTQVIKGINGRKVGTLNTSSDKKELLDNIDKMDAEQLREFNKIYNEYMKGKGK